MSSLVFDNKKKYRDQPQNFGPGPGKIKILVPVPDLVPDHFADPYLRRRNLVYVFEQHLSTT